MNLVFSLARHSYLITTVGNLIASLDFTLRIALIPGGLINHGGDKLWWIQRKRSRIRGGSVEKQRPPQDLFRIVIKSLLIWHQIWQLCNCFSFTDVFNIYQNWLQSKQSFTYFKLKYYLRVIFLRAKHWSTAILTCNWSTSTKRYFYFRFFDIKFDIKICQLCYKFSLVITG